MNIPIDAIRTDGGTQPRASVNYDVIEEYVDAMEAGATFPPVDVFYDGTQYWLADGFHRIQATFGAGNESIECTVHQGTLQDAQWFSFAANKTNGLYRSNADKQRCVLAALNHPKGAALSDSQIAEHVGVHQVTVGTYRKTLTYELHKSDTRTGRDGRTINVANIGKSKRESSPAPVAVHEPEARPSTPARDRETLPAPTATPEPAVIEDVDVKTFDSQQWARLATAAVNARDDFRLAVFQIR